MTSFAGWRARSELAPLRGEDALDEIGGEAEREEEGDGAVLGPLRDDRPREDGGGDGEDVAGDEPRAHALGRRIAEAPLR
jgi:hypothetical protein